MNKESAYQVCTTRDEVYACIKNKASYLNCLPFRTFLNQMVEQGKKSFVVDFRDCTSMDSTFLGILVGLALELRKHKEKGQLTLVNLMGRNLETVQNLGIHKIATVSSGVISNPKQLENLNSDPSNIETTTEIVYQAHKTLLELNEKNSRIFSDVVHYLEQKIEDSS